MKDYIISVFHRFVPITLTTIPVSEDIETLFDTYLENPNFICIGTEDVGVIIGLVYPSFWNNEVLVAQELGLWVEPEHRNSGVGKALIEAFEKEAKILGAKETIMSVLTTSESEKVKGMYDKFGYKPLESSYIKGL